MGRLGSRVLGVALVLGSLVGRSAYAGNFGLTQALGVLMMGATHSEPSRDYGELIGVDPRVTVRLGREGGHCTATFINSVRVLTAAHCINPKLPAGGVNIDGIASVAAHAHKGFVYPKEKPGFWAQVFGAEVEKEKTELNPYDIAVVDFPEGTAEFLGVRKFPAIAKKGFEKGHVYFAGYGIDDFFSYVNETQFSGAGLLGWGVVNVVSRKDGYLKTDEEIIFTDRAKQKKHDAKNIAYSHALPGDSGGALYNEAGEIVGISSAMLSLEQKDSTRLGPFVVIGKSRYTVFNYFIDITSDSSREEIAHQFETQVQPTSEGAQKVSMDAPLPDPFEKLVLRTGQFALGKETIGVVPNYHRGELESVVLYEKLGTPERVAREYVCSGSGCYRDDYTEMIEVKPSEFTRFSLEQKNEEKLENGTVKISLEVSKELGTYTLQ